MSFGTEASALGVIAMLGLRETLVKQAYMTLAAAKRGFMSQGYSHHQRRAQLFMLRLTMDWLGHTGLEWPAYAHDEPMYEELLATWRTPDPQALVPASLCACDRHTSQTGRETERRRLDFHEELCLDRVPVEILLLCRLRDWEGLGNPVLEHPLMEAPFDRLIEPQTLPPLEDLHERVLRRARSDWDDYDHVLSLETMRAHALAAARSEVAKGA